MNATAKAAPDSERIKILMVDDEILEFKVLQQKMKSAPDYVIDAEFAQSIEEAVERTKQVPFELILVDNRLLPNNDFRETVPRLREIGYTGPIGVVSSDISDSYFQEFEDFGVDFRIGKDEIDYHALRHIISEYVSYKVPEAWREDMK
ncbi:response regulator [Rhizobium sp. LjRoot254]|jgi:DNA-binding NarL/FixJ family response regulator|uniref:response regulator n=1 Tax=Rhizobium sp. LjRoot254 TaxID=3342297 RepID=UPI003ECC8344